MKSFIVFFLGLLPLVTSSDCYFRNGTNVPNGQYVPCRTTPASMCCGTNRDYNIDICMDNGLCNAAYSEKLFRESCTDPTWASPYCLGNICTNTAEGGEVDQDAQVVQCSTDGTYCCGNVTETECCEGNDRFSLAAVVGAAVSSVTSNIPTSSQAQSMTQEATSAQASPLQTTSTGTTSPQTISSDASSSETISTAADGGNWGDWGNWGSWGNGGIWGNGGTSTTSTGITSPNPTNSPITTSQTSISPSITTAPVSFPSHSSSSSLSPTPSTTKPNIISIGIGVGLGIPLLCSLAALFYFLRRRRLNNHPADHPSNEEVYETEGTPIKASLGGFGDVGSRVELPIREPAEMGVDRHSVMGMRGGSGRMVEKYRVGSWLLRRE